MFQRRLRILLIVLLVVSGGLVLRALQLQVIDRDQWAERADKALERPQLVETIRGRILDYRGREVALDEPCMDLCVDYRAVLPGSDDKWVRALAIRRLTRRLGEEYTRASRAARVEMADAEVKLVRADVERMWATIARVSGRSTEEVEEARRSIVQRVEMRRRYLWVHRWRAAVTRQQALPQAPWYQRWMMGEGDGSMPALDSFDMVVDEQRAAHVVLPDVDTDTVNFFARDPDRYPGLVLRPGVRRHYPFGEAGCHLIGNLAKVAREDLLEDDGEDELRKYWPNDQIGRTGVEALAEPLLRGSRGRVVKVAGRETERVDPRPGRDVRLTIDIELQREIQAMFRRVAILGADKTLTHHAMHGAAVVIDVPTGEVRAMASYPDYDLNRFDEDYPKLASDALNAPLLNRATQVAREPGSTAKPMIGLAAITQGLISPYEGIECTGYLVLGGKRYGMGRCWTASRFAHMGIDVSHHKIPYNAQHPTGRLSFADALERSCNIYFETLGDQMKVDGISQWYRRFGLGRPTGVGVAEASGYVPADFPRLPERLERNVAWFTSIGQDKVAATPIQMANVAATIARDGVWLKPRLLTADTPLPARAPATRPATRPAGAAHRQPPAEDRVDLRLSPAAVRAAKLGMYNVVNGPAGTGKAIVQKEGEDRADPSLAHFRIAGKTGTATASAVRVPVKDEGGNIVRGTDGKPVTRLLRPAVPGQRGEVDWYRATDPEGKNFNHAWFMGFAPAEDPRIAFVVLVEYGESGGATAGRVAKRVIEACIEHGYLPPAGGGRNTTASGR